MKQLLSSTFILFLLLAAPAVRAQGPGNGGPRPGAVTDVPVDGGASLLLAAGTGYALRRLRKQKA
ncbi:PID-CTERM protein-sorting domain-containing protein [Hymenobacter persicinus]|uniref:VPDSG-CTERM sorting domain-containing protein n=1 Tax=Hymenobacter persicinus TaxID=2025506 RepID=A0A4Q5LBY7_9BACT|nr:hypothetical protein [Hymenobacter persicinus]RYU78640.1 hypothetical protein EWM57_13435 [Hymenobacter persicinus]